MINPKIIAFYLFNQFLSILVASAVLFWSAGRIDWWAAWATCVVWVFWFATEDVIILRFNPGLMAERLKPPQDAKTWDRVLVSSIRLIELARYILAGLDQRNNWTVGFPWSAQMVAFIACLLSTGLFFWAMASNNYFSQVVRVQSDRGHTVATSGPYRYVRHPAYVGMILFELALSTLLASWGAIIAGGLCAILFVVRAALEDRTLQIELAGYAEYARQVRYRLLPHIW